ncbi:MAG: Ig-like domain-containing protein, partial [Treponema sp.]|nr:Ig-like domain-containing protein [Treponema sp.]
KESAGTITMNGTPYDSIQAALDAAASASGDCVITLTAATYKENGLKYSGSNNLKISGLGSAEYGKDVVILGQGADLSSEKGRSTFAIAGSGNIVLENLTIKSTRQNAEGTAQAEVIGTDGSGNLAAYNCSFLSGQDTMRTVAKAWFYKCYIEGDVDFTWMEYTNGVAALYEECVLHAIGTRTTKAYFTAPRLGITSKVGKGLVIFNSKLEAESGLKELYLGRNPWASSNLKDYYEQVAFIGTTYDSSNVALHADVWASAANGTADQKYIGFKTDENFPKGKYGVVLDKDFVAAEYAGRENILNRLFVVASSKFQKDTEGYWDIAKVISDNKWNVTVDSSKSLLDGEGDPAELSKTYVLDSETVDGLSCNGFAFEQGKTHYVGQNGSTISIPVTGKAVVTVTGYYSGEGTIQAGSQGKALFDFNNKSTTKLIEKPYVVYSEDAGNVTVTASATTYITKISVEYDNSLTFKPVTAITLDASGDATELASKKALQFSATLTPDAKEVTNSDIIWSITGGSEVATIDQNGLLTAGSADADTSVTVRVTSCDANAVFGEKTITVKKLEAKAFDVSWLDSEEHSSPDALDCTNGNAEIATGAAGTASTLPDGYSWANAKTADKVTAGNGGIYSATSDTNPVPASYDTFYADFSLTAVKACTIESVSLGGVNYGTGNVKSKISYKRASDSDYTEIAKDLATRSITAMLSTDCSIPVAAGETITIRVAAVAGSEQKGNRSPGIPQVTVSGSAQ